MKVEALTSYPSMLVLYRCNITATDSEGDVLRQMSAEVIAAVDLDLGIFKRAQSVPCAITVPVHLL